MFILSKAFPRAPPLSFSTKVSRVGSASKQQSQGQNAAKGSNEKGEKGSDDWERAYEMTHKAQERSKEWLDRTRERDQELMKEKSNEHEDQTMKDKTMDTVGKKAAGGGGGGGGGAELIWGRK